MFSIFSAFSSSRLLQVSINGSATENCTDKITCTYNTVVQTLNASDTLIFLDNFVTIEATHTILSFYVNNSIPMKFIGSSTVFIGNESETYLINTTNPVEIRDCTFRSVNIKFYSSSSSILLVNSKILRADFRSFDVSTFIESYGSDVSCQNVTFYKINGSFIDLISGSLTITRTTFKEINSDDPLMTFDAASIKITKADLSIFNGIPSILNQNTSNLHLSNVEITDILFTDTIIKSFASSILMKKIYIKNTTAMNRVILLNATDTPLLKFSRCTFDSILPKLNRSQLINIANSSINVEDITYKQNSFMFGEFYNSSGSISNITFEMNKLYKSHSLLNITNSKISSKSNNFINNTGKYGTAYNINNSTATIRNCVFENNTAKKNGGVISSINSSLTVLESKFTNNFAINGGSVYIAGESSSEFTKNTFTNNTADYGFIIFIKGKGKLKLDQKMTEDQLLVDGDIEMNTDLISEETTTIVTEKPKISYEGKLLGDVVDDGPENNNATVVIGGLSILLVCLCVLTGLLAKRFGKRARTNMYSSKYA